MVGVSFRPLGLLFRPKTLLIIAAIDTMTSLIKEECSIICKRGETYGVLWRS